MKKNLLAVMLLVGIVGASFGAIDVNKALAFGSTDDWIWTLNDHSANPYQFAHQANFSDGQTRVLLMSGSTLQPFLAPMVSGIRFDGTSLLVDNLAETTVNGLVSDLAGKANLSHLHTTSDITGLAAFVDSRLITSSQPDWNEASTTAVSFIKNKPTIPTVSPMVFATTTRSLNTAFQVSSTSAAFVSYTVDITAALSLSGGATGTVTLQYADDSGFTTNVKTVQSSVNGNSGTLTVGLGLTQTGTAALTGIIPAGKYVKIITANTVGTPTFTYRTQQEVLMPSN